MRREPDGRPESDARDYHSLPVRTGNDSLSVTHALHACTADQIGDGMQRLVQ